MIHVGALRQHVATLLAVLLLAAGLALYVADLAGASAQPCDRHAADSQLRARSVTGRGQQVLVIGDSWSVGLGLDDLGDSWPSRLSGRVRVAGFSGSGFSAGASTCPGASFAERAGKAVESGADLVVVEGGLNDYDQSPAATTRGFERLIGALAGHRVVVVGPAEAPSREVQAQRVDALLYGLAREHEVAYISTIDLSLDYLEDGLHLTEAGHREFGEAMAVRLADLAGTTTD